MGLKKIKIFVCLALSCGSVIAQDAAFSQFYASELYLNPALAGVDKEATVGTNFRSQWGSIIEPYVTSQVSLIVPYYAKGKAKEQIGGAGLSVFNDQVGKGDFKTTAAYVSFAYIVNISEYNPGRHLTFGLQAGIVQKSIDYSNLGWGKQYSPYQGYDESISSNEEGMSAKTLYPDFSAGVIYSSDPPNNFDYSRVSGFGGLAVYHLGRPNESLVDASKVRLPMLFKAHGGVQFRIADRWRLSPNTLILVQNKNWTYDLGIYGIYRAINQGGKWVAETDVIIGLWQRFNDSFVITAGSAQANYTLGISFDYNSSVLQPFTRGRGAYEISLSVRLVKSHTLDIVSTPRI